VAIFLHHASLRRKRRVYFHALATEEVVRIYKFF